MTTQRTAKKQLATKKGASKSRGERRTTKIPNKKSGGGGVAEGRRINWKLSLPLVGILSLVGGYFVYKSMASVSTWRPGSSAVMASASVMPVTKENGTSYWYFDIPGLPALEPGIVETLKDHTEIGRLTLTNSDQGAGVYCADVRSFTRPVSVRFGGASVQLPAAQLTTGRFVIPQETRQDVCVTADLSASALTVILDRDNVREQADTHTIIYSLFKQSSLPTPLVVADGVAKKCSQLTGLKFCDDFDGPNGSAPDSTKWKVYNGGSSWGSQCWSNKPENIAMDGAGNLKLTLVNKTTTQCTNSYGAASTVTSGAMDSSGRFTTKYGTFEIRAKLSCAKGVWGALWLSTGTGPGWPQSGEIDIYEIGYDKQNRLQQTIHAGKSNSDKYMLETYWSQTPRYCDSYHVYGAEWRQGYIQFTLDGKPTNRITEADGLAAATRAGKTPYWPFNSHDLRLIIDLQYGKAGSWTGTPNLAELPSSMLIDYVRVYE